MRIFDCVEGQYPQVVQGSTVHTMQKEEVDANFLFYLY